MTRAASAAGPRSRPWCCWRQPSWGRLPRGDGFDQNVRPLLQKHCLRCHGGEKPKGDVNLAKFADRGVAPQRPRFVAPGRRRPGRADHAAAGQPGRSRTWTIVEHAADSIQAILDAVEGARDPGSQPDPAADPPAIQQHDPRPARRRHAPGRRLPRRRRRRRRVRQQRLDPVRPADPHGEVPGRGRRRVEQGRPVAVHRGPARPGPARGRRPPADASPRSPGAAFRRPVEIG